MLRNLSQNELNQVSGGADYYPPALYGYELVGWEQELLGYDVVTWTEHVSFFHVIEHETVTPIYQINPIYAPVVTTVYYY